jgi:hypothetical protein
MGRTAVVGLTLALLAAALSGCASPNEEWADTVNPCCGQDLIEKGVEPPVDRCADMVVDQVTAMRLMKDLTGGAVAHWEVRLIPGGPACIWRMWPGDTSFKAENVQPDWVGDEPARGDTTAAESARSAPVPETETGGP